MGFLIRRKIVLLLLLLFFYSCPFLITAQPHNNVSLGSSLVANNAVSSAWISPSGDFAFGFQRMGPAGSGYLLAIWFDKIPEKTIIWCANRNHLVQEGSKIQLFTDGKFELDDPNGHGVWVANFAGVAHGAMLDNGNFVLATNASKVMWQTFSHPFDSILPTQILYPDISLISSLSETNSSHGRFQVSLKSDGDLTFCTRNFPTDSAISDYWSTNTVGNRGVQWVFNQSGYIFLADNNGTALSYLSSKGASMEQYYQRATMDHDGVLRHYLYPKIGNSSDGRVMEWSVLAQIPSNICTSISQSTGRGACGFNSICSLQVNNLEPVCSCPTGYSQVNPNDRMSGCKPDFDPQSCDIGGEESGRFTFVEMANTDWPEGDYDVFEPVTEDWCREDCLDDCFCAVAVYSRGYCRKKRYPFANGRNDSSVEGKALVKVRKFSKTSTSQGGGDQEKWNRSTTVLAIAGSAVLVGILLAASLLVAFLLRRRATKIITPSLAVSNIRNFSFSELQEATSGFKQVLGKGACSTVYRGTLKNENGKTVAVKKLDRIAPNAEREFKAEVGAIGRTNHKNLVQLLGYCDEDENRLLVYEFMSNGSVASFLFDGSRPNWQQRVQIAVATARGLCYLHEECSNQIIHCDIKPQNVLLDEFFVPKISDFGLAKLLKADQTRPLRGSEEPEGMWLRSGSETCRLRLKWMFTASGSCCWSWFAADDMSRQRLMMIVEWFLHFGPMIVTKGMHCGCWWGMMRRRWLILNESKTW